MAEALLTLPDRTDRRTAQITGLNLWDKAVLRLSEQDKQCIDVRGDKRTVLVDLLNTVTERQQACIGKQWKYTKRNGDVVYVRDALARVLDGVKRFQQIGDIAVQYDPTHAALPWAGVRVLLKIAINDHEMHAAMLDAVEQVSRLIVRYAIVETMYLKPGAILQEQLRDCIVELYVAVLTYLATARAYYDRGAASRFSRAVVQSSSNVDRQLAVIYEHAKRIDEIVGLIEADFTRSRARFMMEGFGAMKDGLNGIDHSLHGMCDQLQEFADRFDQITNPLVSQDKLLHWLNAVFTDEEWETALKARTPGTCEWILWRRPFQDWSESAETSLLWIHGSPGYGKTVLCAHLIKHLQTIRSGRVAYFFCTSDNEEKRQPLAIIRSWVSQLISHPEVLAAVRDVHHGKEGRHSATTADVWQIFRQICERTRFYFVVDGLDECSDGRQIAEFLTELSTAACRILIVSRPHADIRAELRRLADVVTLREYEIVSTDTQMDIVAFSTHMVASRLPKKSESLQSEMVQEAARRSQSMFLWVRLLGDRLDPTENIKELRKIVKEMPKEIEEAYAAELRRIENTPRRRERAVAVLRWVLFAQRPLSVREITEALAVEEGDEDEYPIDNLPDSWEEDGVDDRIQRLCGSLITLKGREEQRPAPEQTVHFVHFSVREYLATSSFSLITFNAAKEHDLLAQICLRYLCFPELASEEHYSPRGFVAKQVQQYGLLYYAARFWSVHAQAAEWSAELTNLTNKFFEPSSHRWKLWPRIAGDEILQSLSFCQVIDVSNPDQNVPSLFYAALLGLRSSVRRLIEMCDDINQTSTAGAAIHGAVVGGHIDTVRLLIEYGADLNIRTPITGMTPLHFAAIDGRLAISELLLANGADVRVCNNDGIAPLQSEAFYTTSDMIKSLLGQGDRDNLRDKANLMPLHYAAFGGYVDLVRLLVEHKADINASDSDGMTPLYYAIAGARDIAGDHLSIVKLFLEAGTDIDGPQDANGTPLHAAASAGQLDIVRCLLDAGAMVDARNQKGATALFVAALTSLDVVKCLAQHGADLNARDPDEDTSLHCAAAAGAADIVAYLLDQGADLHAKDSLDRTPLHFARSKPSVTELLLQAGADATCPSRQGFTPLHFAAASGNKEVGDMLLRFNAQVNAGSTDLSTPLHFACMKDELDMAQWLLEHGADVNAVDRAGEPPLHIAVHSGHERMIRLLVANNADLNMQPSYRKFGALHVAADKGDLAIVEILADGGAQLDICSDQLETPLQTAAYAGHAAIVESLLKRGANGTNIDGHGRSAFDWIAQNPEVFANLSIDSPQLTDNSLWKRALNDSITKCAWELLDQQTDWKWDKLGRNLLLLSDISLAHPCLVQAVSSKGFKQWFQIQCDMCDGMVRRTRFVCQICPDLDLCPRCMPLYPNPEKLPMCRTHDFYEVRIDSFKTARQLPLDDVTQLLQRILARYGKDEDTEASQAVETEATTSTAVS